MRTIEINGKMRGLSGWVKDRPVHNDPMYQGAIAVQPKIVDLSSNCSRIEDQDKWGSCTANSSTSAMEFLYKKIGKPQPELSRFFLYYATRVWISGGKPSEDAGAMLRDVMKALARYGTCLETIWPYVAEDFEREPSADAKKDALNHQIVKYYRLPNLASIKTCMALGYPAVGGFSVPASMMDEDTARTGIVKYPKPTEEFVGGHAIFFVGYDDNKQLLKFQNSWGVDWGDHGFGYLPYRYVTDWLANDFWTIQNQEF